MNRKQRRKATREAKQQGQEELASKIALFGKMPDKCLTCDEPFDKQDREMVMSWNVIVHGEEEVVRLYCPECWNKALRITADFKKHLQEKYGMGGEELPPLPATPQTIEYLQEKYGLDEEEL